LFTDELRGEISQGDVFHDMEFPVLASDGTPSVRRTSLMLLSHDCDYDKPNNPYCLVASVSPLALVPSGNRENIRRYRVINTFYLREVPDVLDESYVDIRLIATIDKGLLVQADREGRRAISLTEQAREALQDHLFLFFAREDVPS